MTRRIRIVSHMPRDAIEQLYRREKNHKIRERLQAILLLLDGRTAKEIASILRRNEKTIRLWAQAWNARGYDGLKPWKGQKKKPRISEDEWKAIAKKAIDENMTLKEVFLYIRNSHGELISYKTTWYWLRKKLKIPYGKPYISSDKRPKDAEKILKKD